jgi:general secretion pathway protein D
MSPPAGSTFTINVIVKGAQDLSAVPAQLTFDPSKLQLLNVSQGSFMSRDGQVVVVTHREDNGTIVMSASRPPRTPGVSGNGPVFTLTFMAKAPGSSNLVLSRGAGRNSGDQPVPLSGAQAVVAVR